MRKSSNLIWVFVGIMFLAHSALAAEETWFSQETINGNFVIQELGYGKKIMVTFYVVGALDAIEILNTTPDWRESLYPNLTDGEIVDLVINYYQNNPGNRNDPVIKILLQGCK